ncbi:hypothetical protein BEWA_041620 [Theileria equi strain WA]|uniref:AP2/ERF domain-containing protein n=1 Tax=Theileria equi strain WA TaxID=1537102 RepID=L1LFS1_THEEQ|nr:hypothetical protein BEWA_041620 [Theileria equi strain WA]EKX74124.1 hypothetical protein BEWA_041620 [Theileria equi strain WA]|eukprot:XP_004833576.1 hypothetical protein BEWA_041620 [Theileria equi strain WA]
MFRNVDMSRIFDNIDGDKMFNADEDLLRQMESERQKGLVNNMQDYKGADFDHLLNWIDTIVSLCRNLDGVCHKIDGFFPSDDGSNTMAWLRNAMEERESLDFSSLYANYAHPEYTMSRENFSENQQGWGMEDPGMLKSEGSGKILPQKSRKQKKGDQLANLKLLENGGEMIVVKRRKKRSTNVNIIKVTNAYDYLLEIPWFSEPDPSKGSHQYKCSIPGVYWDKRSWIASWYRDGRRYYSSFSAKLHGFYKSKYYAIQVRLYNTMYNGQVRKPEYNVKDSYDNFCKEVL